MKTESIEILILLLEFAESGHFPIIRNEQTEENIINDNYSRQTVFRQTPEHA